jgi:site-specific DNA-adenine methylase
VELILNLDEVKMAFGLPYMGSKNIYAKQICDALPSGKRLVDLFAGGCAITDCAIKKYANKWGSFLINDIAHEPLDLYAKCLCGKNPVSYEWVSREEFKQKDWATRLVWSFGNGTSTYLYGREIEPIKHDIESWIVDGVILNNSSILRDIDLPKIDSMKARYSWWRGHKKLLSNLQINVDTQRLLSLERLERLERLEFSYLSYEQYEYRDGDVVYCDIPYKGTYCKQYKDTGFDHAVFWEWAKSQSFDVFVSERVIPDDVEVILTKEVANRANPKGIDGFKTEYLVRV